MTMQPVTALIKTQPIWGKCYLQCDFYTEKCTVLSQRNASNAFRKCDNNINQHEQKKESKNGGKDVTQLEESRRSTKPKREMYTYRSVGK